MTTANLPALLQHFFTDRLHSQLGASPHTVASYRDAFRLLLVFASQRLGRAPSRLRVEDLDTALLGAFLEHLEHGRVNTPKTRNTRLAALRAFFRFVAYAEPACSLFDAVAILARRFSRSFGAAAPARRSRSPLLRRGKAPPTALHRNRGGGDPAQMA